MPLNSRGKRHKHCMYAECAGISELRDDERSNVEKLVEKLLNSAQYAPGLTDLTEHHIHVTDPTPIKEKPQRISPKMLSVAQEEVQKMSAEGIIERSASDYCSAPVILRKRDGGHRTCIDYRPLNKVTKKDAYPLPNMDSLMDKLRGAKYLSKIDLKAAYHQIPMARESKKYTFAVPGSGLWQFTRMPFGLTNAPMTFQRLIDSLLGPELEPYVFGYLDDIIITTETFEEHLKWVEVVLKKLVDARLKINQDKCEFCCSRVTYLGVLLDQDGLRPDPDRVAALLNYPTPTNLCQLRGFLGIVNWYERFIEHCADLKVPLLKLLRKKQRWIWEDDQREAFEELKAALTTAPVLARPDFSKPFYVQCDASGSAHISVVH